MSWKQISGQVSNREYASSVVFQNKLYVAMGRRSGVCLNDMYSTQDGENWVNNGPMKDSSGNAMDGRLSYGLCENNNKVYLMGGYKGVGDYLNDVYVTSDMKNWKRLQDAPWSKRYACATLSFDDKIWVLGGRDASGGLNEVWWSTDGVSWHQEPNAPWAARRLYGGAFVYNNRLYVVGGLDDSGVPNNDVYNTFNGKSWKKVDSNYIFSARRNIGISVIDGKKIVITGGKTGSGYSNRLYHSNDGVIWGIGDTISSDKIYGHTMNYFNKKLVVVGGLNQSGANNSNVLISEGLFGKNQRA